MSKMDIGRNRRQRERLNLSLSIRVSCREANAEIWEETTRSIDVTPFGAGFMLSRPVKIGKLLLLALPMPRQLRCFDHLESQYKVWCLVRHVRVIKDNATQNTIYSIGVAFIGKYPPASYNDSPETLYEVIEPNEIGFWRLREVGSTISKNIDDLGNIQKKNIVVRNQMRLSVPISVMIEVFNESGETIASELTETENISSTGASVFTNLEIENGRFVRISSESHNLNLVAIVRSRKSGEDGNTRLHLEFIDRQFPLEEIGKS
jgi:hypothetical protein